MYHVDITADLNDEDEPGYVWTFLDEARDPGQITSQEHVGPGPPRRWVAVHGALRGLPSMMVPLRSSSQEGQRDERCEDGLGVTDDSGDTRQQRNAWLRVGMLAAVGATTTLIAGACGGGSPANSAPPPDSGHLYWADNNWIGRAHLNGTGVSQRIVTIPGRPRGVAVDPDR
jgi:hypothetical protein